MSKMVDRFLGWPLPKTFAPDCGISFDGRKDDEWNKNKTWPIGTNLFTAFEARQMLEHVLGDQNHVVDNLVVKAGDTVVVLCEQVLNREQAEMCKQMVAANLPAGVKCIVLAGGASISVLSQPMAVDSAKAGAGQISEV